MSDNLDPRFTPGPWAVRTVNRDLSAHVRYKPVYVVLPGGRTVKVAEDGSGDADARLMAAAPAGFAAAEEAYVTLLNCAAARDTLAGQAALCQLRDYLAEALGADPRDVSDHYEDLRIRRRLGRPL
jgi:hypothetical protein